MSISLELEHPVPVPVRTGRTGLLDRESVQRQSIMRTPRSSLRAGPGCTRVGDLALHSHDQMK